MEKPNAESIFKNLIWKCGERAGNQVVSFIVTLVIARILMPEDYGTVALINVIIQILNVFVDSGLGSSLVQKKDADEKDYATVFTFNMIFCVIMYALLYFAAPIIALFYGNSVYIQYIRVAGITILISGIKGIQQSYVQKNMIFKKFFFSTLGGTVVSAIISIYMATHGYGVWALIAQNLINNGIDTFILWLTVGWKPRFGFSGSRFLTLFSFGSKYFLSVMADTIYQNIRKLIIGKVYSSDDLAYYNKGAQFPELIINNIVASIDGILFPAMANVQDDIVHVKNMTRRSIKESVYLTAPLMIGMAAIARPMVKLLLTEKWLPCVPFLRIFCIVYVFYAVHTSNLNAIKALGHSDIFLKLEITKKIIGISILVVTMRYGVLVMAYGLFLNEFLSQIVNTWPNKKLLNYSYKEQIKDILPYLFMASFMGVIVYLVGLWEGNYVLLLIIQILLGLVVYIVLSVLLKIEEFYYLINVIKRVCKKKNQDND